MLTGDKGATAKSLATQCQMLNANMKVYKMSEHEDLGDQLEAINGKAKQKYRAMRAQREGNPRASLVQKRQPRTATINEESLETSLILNANDRFKSVAGPGK